MVTTADAVTSTISKTMEVRKYNTTTGQNPPKADYCCGRGNGEPTRQPKWRNFERESCKIALKIAFPEEILLNDQPGTARIALSSIEKSL